MADFVVSPSLIESLQRHAMHERDIAQALAELRSALDREGIPFAVVGALAMAQHGYVRHSEDIDVVTTAEGLASIHDRLVGRGLAPRAEGLRKKLRDVVHKVDIDVVLSGEHAGAAGSPVVYPHPEAPEFEAAAGGVRYATLPALLAFKLASGIWGKRPQDLADVYRLIQINALDESYASRLPQPLRERFTDLVAATREEVDIE